MQPMICLAYMSSARQLIDAQAMAEILTQSRVNNARKGITGMLCHYDGSFLQFLEGQESQVTDLFKTISRDPRHTRLLEVYRGFIEQRAFPEWTMATVTAEALSPEHGAFCQSLRDVKLNAAAKHQKALEPFLQSFRAWLR